MSGILSEGKNYRLFSNLKVSPRTGGVTYHIVLGGVQADIVYGPKFSLALQYDSLLAEDKYGFGTGWYYNLTEYDNETHHIRLSDGSTLLVLFDEDENPSFQYQKLKNREIQKASDPHMLFDIFHKNGNIETLNKDGHVVQITNASGKSLNFEYDEESEKLTQIKGGGHSIEISEKYGNTVVKSMNCEGVEKIFTLIRSSDKLSGVQLNVPDTEKVSFEYTEIEETSVLNRVNLPTGGYFGLEYTTLKVPTGGPVGSVPAVKKFNKVAYYNQPEVSTSYIYGDEEDNRNYLGYSSEFNYIKDEDNLFNQVENYIYKTFTDDGEKKTRHYFNKFHLPIKVEILDGEGNLRKVKTSTYPLPSLKDFSSLPANYQLAIEEKTEFHNPEKNDSTRTVTAKKQYDDYGNLLMATDCMGKKLSCEYLTLKEMQALSPELKNERFVKFLKSRARISSDGKETIMEKMQYTPFKQAEGSGVFLLKTAKTHLYNGMEIRKSELEYEQDVSKPYYGYKIAENTTAQEQSVKMWYAYDFSTPGEISHQTQLAGGENYSKKISAFHTAINLLSKSDIHGNLHKYSYDTAGRIVSVEEQIGDNIITTQKRYVSRGQSEPSYTEIIFPEGVKQRTEEDGLGRVLGKYIDEGKGLVKKAEKTYDERGNVIKLTVYNVDPVIGQYSLTNTYEYDVYGYVVKVVNAAGIVIRSVYDEVANTVTHWSENSKGQKLPPTVHYLNDEGKEILSQKLDSAGKVYSYKKTSYDGFGRIISVEVNGKTKRYEYDIANHTKTIIDPLGSKKTISGDKIMEKPVSIRLNDKELAQNIYDEYGRLLKKIDCEGNAHEFTYDKGRMIQAKDAVGNKINYTYEKNVPTRQDFTSPDNELAHTLEIYYDNYGRINKYIYDKTDERDFTFDETGMIESVRNTYKDCELSEYTETYTYDESKIEVGSKDNLGNEIEYIRDTQGRTKTLRYNGEDFLNYHYDDFNRIALVERIDGISVEHEYDEFSRTIKQTTKLNGTAVETIEQAYNNDNLIVSLKTDRASHGVTEETFAYDDGGKLVKHQLSEAGQQTEVSFVYDLFNNLTEVKNNGEIVEQYFYDSKNPVKLTSYEKKGTKRTLTYDKNNACLDDGQNKYSYDVRGLVEAVNGETQYRYSQDGRIKTITEKASPSKYYIYSSSGELKLVYKNKEEQDYIIGANKEFSLNKEGRTSRVTSTTHNVSVKYTSWDKELSLCQYEPYGEKKVITGKESEYGYEGNMTDASSGALIFGNGMRFYSPELRRFLQHDSLSPFGKGGPNGFAFESGDPVNSIDPSGNFSFKNLLENAAMMIIPSVFFDWLGLAAAAEEVAVTAASTAEAGTSMIEETETSEIATQEVQTLHNRAEQSLSTEEGSSSSIVRTPESSRSGSGEGSSALGGHMDTATGQGGWENFRKLPPHIQGQVVGYLDSVSLNKLWDALGDDEFSDFMNPILTKDGRKQLERASIVRPFDRADEQDLLREVEANVPHDEGSPPYTTVKGLYYRTREHSKLYDKVLKDPNSISDRGKALLNVAENIYRERGEQFDLVKRLIKNRNYSSQGRDRTFSMFWQRSRVKHREEAEINYSWKFAGKYKFVQLEQYGNVSVLVWDYT